MSENPQFPNRRDFAKKLAAGAGAIIAGGGAASAADKINPANRRKPLPTRPGGKGSKTVELSKDGKHVRTAGSVSNDGEVFRESARNIPVVADYDVLVVGGGPAGFTAALAAARSGASTMLLEVNGCLGGVWTSGLLSLIIDGTGKPGIMAELLAELKRRSTGHSIGGSWVYDPEAMKLLLEDLLIEAGVKIRLHTRVVAAASDENNRLKVVLTESKSGREAWTARNFIDCSGDGDLAAQAGCEFEMGRPQDGATQPMTMMGMITGVRTADIAPFIRGSAEFQKFGNPKRNLLEEMRKAGVSPSYEGPTIFEVRDGFYAIMTNHQYRGSAIDTNDVTDATLQGRREVNKLLAALKKSGGVWKDLELVTTSEHIGTRGGRRIRGKYYVTGEDLRVGKKFDDGICRVKFGIDVHSVDPSKTKAIEKKPHKSQPYDIPLRAMIARDVSGLMMAGRCISGDFIAHSSYRVTGDAVTMGEAAGVASAVAVANKVLPEDVPFAEVSKVLNTVRADAEKRAGI